MSLSLFMKKNKTIKENVKLVVTKSICDEKGKPLEWEIQPVTTKENEKIREECTKEVPVKGKPGLLYPKVDTSKYMAKLITSSIAFPDLLSAELQDSYGVKTSEDLILEMVDDPGEYADLLTFIQKFNGFDVSINDDIGTAKN